LQRSPKEKWTRCWRSFF